MGTEMEKVGMRETNKYTTQKEKRKKRKEEMMSMNVRLTKRSVKGFALTHLSKP